MEAINGFEASDLDDAHRRVEAALAELDGASIFITGGTGFFGQWLIALLARAREKGVACEVTLLTRSPERFGAECPDLAALSWVSLWKGDVRSFEFPPGRFTHIIHAAAETSQAADRRPLLMISTIVDGARRVLEFATATGVRRLLYVSSGAVYGAQPADHAVIAEDYLGCCDPFDQRTAYGHAKRLAEHLCVLNAASGAFDVVIARAFAFVGPGLPLDGHFAIGNFIADALAGRHVRVNGDGTAVRSYLYAADLAAWLLCLLARGKSGTAYNVGSDAGVTIADLADLVARTLDAPGVVIARSGEPSDLRSRYLPSIARARALGLDAWTGLEDAIRRTSRHAKAKVTAGQKAATHPDEHTAGKTLTLVVDVDGVVASLTPGNDYTLSQPLSSTIDKINRLYDRGHRIIMFTARGSATGIDWSQVTRDQFARWGLKYHELHFGKPAGDYYIDDRLISLAELDALGEV